MPAPAKLVLYDLATKTAPSTAAWRARYALNYFSVPYRTEWIEMPDIEARSKEVGAPPSSQQDGKDYYTVPFIVDPNTGTTLSDSYKIMEYLDKTYRSTSQPSLLPEGYSSDAAQALEVSLFMIVRPFIIPRLFSQYNPRSQAYLTQKHGPIPPMSKELYDAEWVKAKESLAILAREWKSKQGVVSSQDGSALTIYEIVAASMLRALRNPAGEATQEWRDLLGLEGGFWAKCYEAVHPYDVIV